MPREYRNIKEYAIEKSAVSKATLGRLPRYLDFLRELPPNKVPYISATTIAKELCLGEVQVVILNKRVSDIVFIFDLELGVRNQQNKTSTKQLSNASEMCLS